MCDVESARGGGGYCTSVAFNYRGPPLSKAVSAKGMKRVGKRGWWNVAEEEEEYEEEMAVEQEEEQ